MSYNRNINSDNLHYDKLYEDSNLRQFSGNRHTNNVNRRVMERDVIFNRDEDRQFGLLSDSNMGSNLVNSNSVDNSVNNSRLRSRSDIGEITGQQISVSEMEQGMPARSLMTNTDNRSKHMNSIEEQRQMYNPNLDFDLFDHQPQNNVEYFDPSSFNNNSNFSNINNPDNLLTKSERLTPTLRTIFNINNFSWDLLNSFNTILGGKKNLITSPYCVLMLLTTLYRGSSGETEDEFMNVLNLQDKKVAFSTIQNIHAEVCKSPSIKLSNSVYVPKRFPISKRFIEYVRRVANIDLINPNKPEQEAVKMNSTVIRSTNNSLNDVIEPNMINQNTCIMLVSTIYFYSSWRYPFNKSMTKADTFYSSNKRSVPMMHQVGENHKYFEDTTNQVIELDYSDNNLCMGIILPKRHTKIINITDEQYKHYLSKLVLTKINNLKVPRFTQKSKLKMDSLLKKIGMRELFINADLSEMTPTKDIIYVSDIIQQAVVTLIEEGFETGISNSSNSNNSVNRVMTYSRSRSDQDKEVDFIANHPFAFYIRHKTTNVVLFTGCYN